MFGVLAVPGFVFFFGTIFLPESPRWFFMKKRVKDAKKVLLKFNTEDRASVLIDEMEALDKERIQAKESGEKRRSF